MRIGYTPCLLRKDEYHKEDGLRHDDDDQKNDRNTLVINNM